MMPPRQGRWGQKLREPNPTKARTIGMAEPNPKALRVWEGWLPAQARGSSAFLPMERSFPPASIDRSDADKLYFRETLGRVSPPREAAEPLSLQWFLAAESARHNRYGKWLPRLLEFDKHGG